MKKHLATLILILGSILIQTANAVSHPQDTVVLKATISNELIVEFINRDSESLNLSAGEDHRRIADIHVKSNSNTGYEVSWSSVNDGVMVHKGNFQNNSNAKVAYTLSSTIDGVRSPEFSLSGSLSAPVVLGDSDSSATDKTSGLLFTSLPTLVSNVNSVGSTIKSASQMLAGGYEDTITATIAAR